MLLNNDAQDARCAPQSAPGVHEAVLAALADLKGGRLLDLGCGRGELTRKILSGGDFEVFGVDRTNDPGIPGLSYTQADLERAPLPGAFDVVVCTEVIEHLRDPWTFLERAVASMRFGGYLILTTPNIEGIASRLQFLRHGRFLNFSDTDLRESGHIHPLAYWQIELILRQCGVELDHATTTTYEPVVRSVRDRCFLLVCRVLKGLLRAPRPGNILVVRGRKLA